MTGPEANQQHDLWIDRCRQQLQRGAAGNALAAWMQSEGVSAETAASILQMARDRLTAETGQTTHGTAESAAAPESSAPATVDTQVESSPPPAASEDTAQTTESTPALAPRGDKADAFSKAFTKPADASVDAPAVPAFATEDPGPVAAPPSDPAMPPQSPAMATQPPAGSLGAPQQDAADTEANNPVAPQPQTGAAERGDVAPPVEPPTATVAPQTDTAPPAQASPLQAPVNRTAAGDVEPKSPLPEDQEAPAEPLSQGPPQASASPALPPDPPVAAPVMARNPFGTPRPPVVFAAAPAAGDEAEPAGRSAPEPEPQHAGIGLQVESEAPQDPGDAPDEDDAGDASGATDAPATEPATDPAAVPEPLAGAEVEPSAQPARTDLADAREQSTPATPGSPADNLDLPTEDDEDPVPEALHVEPADADAEAAGDSAPRVSAIVPQDPLAEPDDLAEAQPPRDVMPTADQELRPDAIEQPDQTEDPAGEEAARLDAILRESQRRAMTRFDKHFGRRERPRDRLRPDRASATPGPDHAAEDDDDALTQAIHDAGRQEPAPEASIPPGDRGGSPPRTAPAAGSDGALRGGPASPGPEPMTEEELAAAARQLGISFRDAAGRRSASEPTEDDPELIRAARQLGISFRDDPSEPAPLDPDDPMAKAARELGISFRDEVPTKVQQQSTLRRYWPIILVMALAAIAMPVAATVLMFMGK